MKSAYELTILNQRFTIKSDNDEKHVKKVADYVNKKMHDLVNANKAIATSNVAILAALNIADDLFKMRSRQTAMSKRWADQLQGLITRLDEM